MITQNILDIASIDLFDIVITIFWETTLNSSRHNYDNYGNSIQVIQVEHIHAWLLSIRDKVHDASSDRNDERDSYRDSTVFDLSQYCAPKKTRKVVKLIISYDDNDDDAVCINKRQR